MPDVTIYTKATCGYCQRAMGLLQQKNVKYNRIEVTSPEMQDEMSVRANGRRTVPQIFIGQTQVGGCDDLFALERAGKLDAMLGAA